MGRFKKTKLAQIKVKEMSEIYAEWNCGFSVASIAKKHEVSTIIVKQVIDKVRKNEQERIANNKK